MPSPIDVHVHLREPGGVSETIASGTEAARRGGYQAVFDMPNNPRHPTWSQDELEHKQQIAKRTANVDIGFYAGVDIMDPDFRELSKMIGEASGLKLYMDHTTGNAKKFSLETARPVIDHWIRDARKQQLHAPILLHAREGVGFETADYIARQEHHVHWCHVATASEAAMAADLTKRYGQYFTAGVTPHHLTMTDINADFQQGWNGARMQPPLGKEADHDALLAAYNAGDLQILETDHAPHVEQEKLQAELRNPEGNTDPGCVTCFGVSGIEFVVPVMMALVKRKKIEYERLVDSLHHQPKRMLGIGEKALNAKTLWEIKPTIIGEKDAVGKSKNTPYIGWTGWAELIGFEEKGRLAVIKAQPKA